jgi:hypothetical protein
MTQERLLVIGCVAALLAAFGGGAVLLAPARTVSWYVEHPVEMQADIAWCNDNPGRQRENCSAAAEALWKLSLRSFGSKL